MIVPVHFLSMVSGIAAAKSIINNPFFGRKPSKEFYYANGKA